jgi:hypothetical protein
MSRSLLGFSSADARTPFGIGSSKFPSYQVRHYDSTWIYAQTRPALTHSDFGKKINAGLIAAQTRDLIEISNRRASGLVLVVDWYVHAGANFAER